jgi:hypothetical protein
LSEYKTMSLLLPSAERFCKMGSHQSPKVKTVAFAVFQLSKAIPPFYCIDNYLR